MCVCVCVCVLLNFSEFDKMIKISGKVDKSKTDNRFSWNILFFIHGRTFLDGTFFEFFDILAIEEIDEIMVNVKRYKERERV